MDRPASPLALIPLLVLAACSDSPGAPGLQARDGTWQGERVGFEADDGALSGWSLWGIYCEAVDPATGSECLRHPWSSGYQSAVGQVIGGRLVVDLGDGLTLRADLLDEEHLAGTWTLDPGDCCTAEGEWSAEHIADPPPDPVDTGGGDTGGGDTGILDVPTVLSSAEAVCARWNADRAALAEPNTTASAATCSPGSLDADGHAAVVRVIDLYRALAGLTPITTDPALDALAQSCSLLMEANGAITHFPPQSWDCWSEDGAEGASESNLATASAVSAVDLYMIDPGNEDTLGHRRWVLQRGSGPFGVGSAPGHSCLHVMSAGQDPAPAAWSAWPPPGWFPIQAAGSWATVDQVGWSVHTYSTSLAGASATVTDAAGTELPVEWERLPDGYGNSQAIRLAPDGWGMAAGQTYTVELPGTSPPIIYSFEVVDCDAY